LQVQQVLGRDPHCGDLYVFRGRKADLIKIVWHDGIGTSLYAKRLEGGRCIRPAAADGGLQISGAQLAYMLDGIDWVRRVTDGRQRVQVPYDEGVAIHIGPESCADGRETAREALTGVRVGQPLSGVRLLVRSADALQSAEGNTARRGNASAGRLRVVVRPWHARTSPGREPRGLWSALRGRAKGRTAKAGSRRP